MITFFNHNHLAHQGKVEMFRGELVPCFEVSRRVDHVLAELQLRKLGAVAPPHTFDDAALTRIHSSRYVNFLRNAWSDWVALDPSNAQRDVLPSVWPTRTFRCDVEPQNFAARVGLFSFDSGTPLTSGTWNAARTGAHCALSAAKQVLQGDSAAFALSRPPGHHAGADFFGGYCFLNNAAIAAQYLRDGGVSRVAVLDIDYHHGNGTQSIFYDRADVFFASIHGDPLTEYPFFSGHADEQGSGAGLGYNLNIALPRGTGFERWLDALEQALEKITAFDAQVLVVSMGMDTFAEDPISGFTLQSDDYLRVGARLHQLSLPTVLVFEGGYAVDSIGLNAVNLLEAFR